jgi:hypothetical protein
MNNNIRTLVEKNGENQSIHKFHIFEFAINW